MADRRIKDLTAVTGLTTAYKIAVDESAETEAKSATIADIITLVSGTRAATQAVTANVAATVTFTSAMADTTYILYCWGYDTSGDQFAIKVTGKLTTGFTATPAASGTLHYIAMSAR